VLWDQWTKEEIGNGRFTGRLFDDHGKIYHGCTADDAASYAVERIAALGGAFTQRLDDEHLDVYERWARESLSPSSERCASSTGKAGRRRGCTTSKRTRLPGPSRLSKSQAWSNQSGSAWSQNSDGEAWPGSSCPA
jgi:hypothetical protein